MRTATAKAALLHGSRRSPRELRRPYALLIGSVIVGVLLLVVFWATSRIADLLQQQRHRAAAAVPAPAAVGYLTAHSNPPNTAITNGTSESIVTTSMMSNT